MSNRPDLVHDLEIDAPVDAVWAALTDAEELTKWFPFAARVEPGKEIVWDWGPPWEWKQEVEIWEPGKHLRGHTGEQIVDWTLESANGRTMVRLVHSGFDVKTDWEAEHYEGTRDGWAFETQALKHYLERHRGKKRVVVWPRAVTPLGKAAIWAALFAAIGSPAGEGMIEAVMSTGDRICGRVMGSNPPLSWASTAENWNGGLFRLHVNAMPHGGWEGGVWLSAWGVEEGKVREFGDRWQKEVDRRLK